MKNNYSNEDSKGIAWNSDEIDILPGLSCSEASRYITAFNASVHELTAAYNRGGSASVSAEVIKLLIEQTEIVEKTAANGKLSKEESDRARAIGLKALGDAALFILCPTTDYVELGRFLSKGIEALVESGQKNPEMHANNVIMVRVGRHMDSNEAYLNVVGISPENFDKAAKKIEEDLNQ